MPDGAPIDPRKIALERGLAQCSDLQLERLLAHVDAGLPLLLDRGEDGEDCALIETLESYPPQKIVTYSPLAVAASWRKSSPVVAEQDRLVRQSLADMHPVGWKHNTTRGVKGSYFTGDAASRRRDLRASVVAVLEVKRTVAKASEKPAQKTVRK